MNLFETKNDSVLQEDLLNIAKYPLEWENLKDKTFFITGATGLVGASFVRALCCANRVNCLNSKIIILVRSEKKANDIFGDLIERENIKLVLSDITKPISIDDDIDYIIHAAAVTNSKLMVTEPVETIMTAIDGTRNILELAKEKNIKSMIYLSSMEAYGSPDENNSYVSESDYGYVDFLKVRSCYPESKRMAECLCACYFAEYGIPVKMARLAQTFGAGIMKTESRVFSQFARSLINNTDIVLHTQGDSYGNYCYTSDCITALLFMLLNGKNGEAYNVVNESTNIMIRDMAKLVADMSDSKIKVVFDIPEDALKYGYAPSVKMKLCGKKLAELGWEARIDLPEMYERLIKSMKETGNY